MSVRTARVASVHIGAEDTLEKRACRSIDVALDGIVGDRHRGLTRENWVGDKQAEGLERRNERQWSAISEEELVQISQGMDLEKSLQASSLGVNLCLAGISDFSRLPRGTLLTFPSGTVLMVEEYNPPCSEMGEKLAALYTTRSGNPLTKSDFSQAAKFCRGVVGVVEVAGTISEGDSVSIETEQLPKWLRDSS